MKRGKETFLTFNLDDECCKQDLSLFSGHETFKTTHSITHKEALPNMVTYPTGSLEACRHV